MRAYTGTPVEELLGFTAEEHQKHLVRDVIEGTATAQEEAVEAVHILTGALDIVRDQANELETRIFERDREVYQLECSVTSRLVLIDDLEEKLSDACHARDEAIKMLNAIRDIL